MEIVTVVLMVLPFVFASAYYSLPHIESDGLITWLWAISSVAALAWAFVIRRKHPGRAWACVGIGFLQLLLMSLPAFKPVKTRGPLHTALPANGPNDWVHPPPGWAFLSSLSPRSGAPDPKPWAVVPAVCSSHEPES
jgi:hypothetical protein